MEKRFNSTAPKMRTGKLTALSILSAIAFVVMLYRIPVVLFLKYEAKDVIIALGGFIYGPASAALISLVVSLVEMITVSDTGYIGLLMNVLSTCTFVCTASLIYRKRRTALGAALGLLAGVLLSTATMLLWNYLITPFYLNAKREDVAALLVPAILPFNLLKGGLNSALIMLTYKPVVKGLRRAGLIPESPGGSGKYSAGIIAASSLTLVTCILFVLVLRGII